MTSRAAESARILKTARQTAGLTRADVAKRAAIKVIYLESLERGQYVASVSIAHRLVGILRLDADDAAEVLAVAGELEANVLGTTGPAGPHGRQGVGGGQNLQGLPASDHGLVFRIRPQFPRRFSADDRSR
ncbi:MAG: helix-turn-helix domain-containing protein [Acidimicrobiales bacterium]